jgi:hypothetical protein
MARIKPHFKKSEGVSCVKVGNGDDDNSVEVKQNKSAYCGKYNVKHKYEFDKVFTDTDSNNDLYTSLSIEILKALIQDSKDVTFYMYGQTGSGKTHTILGSDSEYGFLYLFLKDVIHINYDATVSVVEIYNNKCYDILNNKNLVHQREDYSRKFIIGSIETKKIKTDTDISDLKKIIVECRKTGESSENDRSSRSHLQICIHMNNQMFRLLDLAGCEKAKDSICSTKDEYKENGGINQSLFALKECIRSLVENKPHIPFRRCELTKMLRHTFQPKCKTLIMSTISQDGYNANTTTDVLNYVCEMKNIKRVVSRKLESVKNRPMIRPTVENFFNASGSPRYKSIFSNKNQLTKLNEMENDLLDEMVKNKSTQEHYDNYMNVLDDKKRIFDSYLFQENKIISKPNPKIIQSKSNSNLTKQSKIKRKSRPSVPRLSHIPAARSKSAPMSNSQREKGWKL